MEMKKPDNLDINLTDDTGENLEFWLSNGYPAIKSYTLRDRIATGKELPTQKWI